MELKGMVQQELTFLLNSARERNTEQGKLVYKRALDALATIESRPELHDLLQKINQSFLGIEAHGFLTRKEFEAVKRLRNIEATFDKNVYS